MDQINSINSISVTEEIKAIETSDENFFYEENFNSLMREELAKKNSEKKNAKKNEADKKQHSHKNSSKDDYEEGTNSQHDNYDESLDNSKNSSIINNLELRNGYEKNYAKHKTVFINLSPKKNTIIPIHKNKKFIEKLSKIMISVSKKIKLLFIFVFQYF